MEKKVATSTLKRFKSIEEVKKAIRNGSKVYVCYERRLSQHSGIITWHKSKGFIRTFMGLEMKFDFSYGRNNQPGLYYAID